MTNAERLLRELTEAGRRGCTHGELSAAGVAFVTVEIERLRERGAVIVRDELPVSGNVRWRLLVPPSSEPSSERSSEDGSYEPAPLFDPPPAPPQSPYEDDRAA